MTQPSAQPSLSNFAAADQIAIAPTSALTPTDEVPFTSMARVNVNPTTGETSTNGTGAHILAQQADISSILSWNASGGDALDAEQALTAITAIIARERPSSSRTLFAAADRTTTINERLSHRLAALYSPRWVSATSFSDIAASESTDLERTTVAPGTLPDDTWTAIDSMASSLTNLTPLANATDDPNAVFDSVTPAILPALSVSSTPSEQLDAATAMTSQVTTMLSSVTVEPSSAVNLINKSANFPVLIRNNLDWPVRVDVTLIPDDPRLRTTPHNPSCWPRAVPPRSKCPSARSAVATSKSPTRSQPPTATSWTTHKPFSCACAPAGKTQSPRLSPRSSASCSSSASRVRSAGDPGVRPRPPPLPGVPTNPSVQPRPPRGHPPPRYTPRTQRRPRTPQTRTLTPKTATTKETP